MNSDTTGATTAEEWGALAMALIADVQAREGRHEAACAKLSNLRRSGTLLARLGLETVPHAVAAAIEAADAERASANAELNAAIEIAMAATQEWRIQTAHEAKIAHSQALAVC